MNFMGWQCILRERRSGFYNQIKGFYVVQRSIALKKMSSTSPIHFEGLCNGVEMLANFEAIMPW